MSAAFEFVARRCGDAEQQVTRFAVCLFTFSFSFLLWLASQRAKALHRFNFFLQLQGRHQPALRLSARAFATALIVRRARGGGGARVAVRAAAGGALAPAVHVPFLSRAQLLAEVNTMLGYWAERGEARRGGGGVRVGDAQLRFVGVLQNEARGRLAGRSGGAGGVGVGKGRLDGVGERCGVAKRFAADALSCDTVDYQFVVLLDDKQADLLHLPDEEARNGGMNGHLKGDKCANEWQWSDVAQLVANCYAEHVSHSLSLPLRYFGLFKLPRERSAMKSSGAMSKSDCNGGGDGDYNTVSFIRTVEFLSKHAEKTAAALLSPQDATLSDLRDASLLDAYYYAREACGKGVRAMLARSLAARFGVPPRTVANLCAFIEHFHQVSLIIDDVQDNSDMRRGRACSHCVFGAPEAIGGAYFQLFRLLDDIPNKFDARAGALVIDGCRVCLRGQQQDVAWRERRYCPSRAEWLEMARGKSGAPFELAAHLALLHASWLGRARLALHGVSRLFTDGEWRSAAGDIVQLCGDFGVFFQIRDDYINLVDEEYWKLHGVCDDLHEKKYSYVVVRMVEERLPGVSDLLSLYARDDVALEGKNLAFAQQLVIDSGALALVERDLCSLRRTIEMKARRLGVDQIQVLLKKLTFPTSPKHNAEKLIR